MRSPRDPRPPRARLASRINSNGRGAGVPSRLPTVHSETTLGTLPRARRFPGSQVVVRREPSPVAFISIAGRISIQRKGRHASASNFPELCNSDGLRHHPSKYRVFARVSGNVGNNNRPARPTSGGYAAGRSPMWIGSWLAYGEILRNSAIGAARSSLRATQRPRVVSIASTKGEIEITGPGATIEIMGQGLPTGTTVRGLTTVQGLTRITTNKVEDIIPRRDSRPHQRSEFSAQRVII